MKIAVFWIVAPCSLVDVYRRFRGTCCLHYQGDVSCIMYHAVSYAFVAQTYQSKVIQGSHCPSVCHVSARRIHLQNYDTGRI
jgi:hypothetical protein